MNELPEDKINEHWHVVRTQLHTFYVLKDFNVLDEHLFTGMEAIYFQVAYQKIIFVTE